MDYKPTIGLEIHVELKTKTKMFCGCFNGLDEKEPNVNVCPICLAHPGTLPVINKKAVEAVLKLGMTLGGNIPETSKFDRKNYFYPDLPKGYQISQYDEPLVLGGELEGIRIRRIHLEEDTARLIHSSDKKSSLVDFNRAGVPLMELVTEPDIKTGEEAVAFASELQLILRYLGISDADMEKGQMRVEANISLWQPIGSVTITENSIGTEKVLKIDPEGKEKAKLGTKVEVKNLNSLRAVKDAINYEIKRQSEVLGSGEKIIQETRGWDDAKQKTFSQRLKEEAHDYRYFPEPDLPPLNLKEFDLERLKVEIPELPNEKRKRFVSEFSLKPEQAEILVGDMDLADYFEDAFSELKLKISDAKPQTLLNYITSDLIGLMLERGILISDLKITAENFACLIELIEKDEVSSRMAKDILKEMIETGIDPHQIIKEKGFVQVSDESIINETIQKIIDNNSKVLEDYKKGNTNSAQFLVGQIMRELKGKGNPGIINKLLQEKLKNL